MTYLRYGTWPARLSKEDKEKFGGEMDYTSIDWDFKCEATDKSNQKINAMWCKNDNCSHYDSKNDNCKRIGEDEKNKNKIGICWMGENEYNHGLSK